MDKTGLTTLEAEKLLKKYGLNELPETESTSSLTILISQFKSPLLYILLLATAVTLYLKEYADSAVIVVAIVVNTVLGFLQERKAGKALDALKKLIHPYARVFRDSKLSKIEAVKIVPGDVVVLSAGDKIPADGVLIEESRFYVSEAILTGEAVPVLKKVNDTVFMGTVVTAGTAKMRVHVTGAKTQIGSIATSVSIESEDTPLKKQLAAFSKHLSWITLFLVFLIFSLGLYAGYDPVVLFKTSVALAVSAIPEGLLVGLTVVLAIGMQRILAKNGLVRNLVSAETLGGVTVLCVDKTGTLTEGKMKVVSYYGTKKLLVNQVVLANDLDDPIVIASWEWGAGILKESDAFLREHPRFDSLPFSSDTQYFASLNYWDGAENLILVNGAPEVLLKNSTLSDKEKKKVLKKIEEFTGSGKRVLGFARKFVYAGKKVLTSKDAEKQLEWVGLLAFEDPIRSDVKESLRKTKRAGIKLIVITGDYATTAETVLSNLKLRVRKQDIVTGDQLVLLSDGELDHRLSEFGEVMLFARTKPDQKLRIVQALKNNGEVVAMMGDGVNDAPALKKADIGIVVGEASDVAKESSSLVLLDSSFSTIIAAIEEGRGIFDNIRKIILYLMSDAFGGIFVVLASFVLRLPPPLTASQILWINLVSDGLPNLALTVDPKRASLMSHPPRSPKELLVSSWMVKLIILISFCTFLISFSLFLWVYGVTNDLALAQSVVFVSLGINTLAYVFSVRTLQAPFWEESFFANKWLLLAVWGGAGFQLAPYIFVRIGNFLNVVPLGVYWVHVGVGAALLFLIIETLKLVIRMRGRAKGGRLYRKSRSSSHSKLRSKSYSKASTR